MTGRTPAPCSVFLTGEHPDHPGWNEWRLTDTTRFNGAVLGLTLVRLDNPAQARTRIFPRHELTNVNNDVHGGVVMALIDIGMFAGSTLLLQKELARGVTLELHNHFVGTGDPLRPLDAVVEVVRETGRLVFARGSVVQDEDIVASFSGIIRKPSIQ